MKLSLLIAIYLLCYQALAQSDSSMNSAYLSDSAIRLWQFGDYDASMATLNKSLSIAQERNDSLQIAKCFNNIGLVYNSKGDPVRSIFFYEQSLTILRKLNNKVELPTSLLNIGIAYKEQGVYDKALRYLFEAAIAFEKRADGIKQSSAYNAIGNISRIEKDYSKALLYHHKALELRREANYAEGIAGSYNNIGIVFKEQKKYDSALFYFQKSIQSVSNNGFRTEHYANTLSHIAEVFEFEKNYSKAENYYDSAYKLRQRIGSKKGVANSLFELGRLQLSKRGFYQAEKYLLQSVKKANEVKANDILLNCYNLLRSIYRHIDQPQAALHYDDLYIELNEYMLGEEKIRYINQMQVKYETENKQREIESLNKEKENREAKLIAQEAQIEAKKAQNKVLFLAIGLLGAILIFILILFFLQRTFAKKIDALLRELHHRVKNNFQVLLSLFSLQQNFINDAIAKSILKSNSNRITAMMLIHRKLYFNKNITTVQVLPYVTDIVQNLGMVYNYNTAKVKIILDIENSLYLDVDTSISLGLLINELVSNSFKYAFSEENQTPELIVTFEKRGQYKLMVKDNCINADKIVFTKSFGLKLINTQVKHLKGTLERSTINGVQYTIIF